MVFDPENTLDYVTNLSFASTSPKGCYTASFQVKRRDMLAAWRIKASYGVIIQDGARIVWQGRIKTIERQKSGAEETVTVQAVGWWVALEERQIAKHWIDDAATSRLRWPDDIDHDLQNTFVSEKRENALSVVVGVKKSSLEFTTWTRPLMR